MSSIDFKIQSTSISAFDHLVGRSFSFQRGQLNIIKGESGCGKTTLFRSILGLDKTYKFDQKLDLHNSSFYIAQTDFVFGKSLFENLFYEFNEHANCRQINRAGVILDALELNSISRSIKVSLDNSYELNGLSGGEKRRLSVARALLSGKENIFIDEPTSGLDALLEKKTLSLLESFSDKHLITIISHADIEKCDLKKYKIFQL